MVPRNPLELLLRRLGSHADLTEEDRVAILRLPVRQRLLEASSYIVREGEPPTVCSVLVSGFAFRQKLTGNGARQIVAIHVPGEAIDFQNLFVNVADHNVQTLTRTEVAFIPRADVELLTEAHPNIARAIIVGLLVDASISREWLVNAGRRDSRAALAHLLCEFAVRLEQQGLVDEYSYELPMTQEQIADALGLTSVHVNRTMRTLEGEGLITRNNRRLRIADWSGLRDVADFNARYLHLDQSGQTPPPAGQIVAGSSRVPG